MIQGQLRGMGPEGDTKITWNSDDPAEVAKARAAFDDYVSKGFNLYKTENIGGKRTGSAITEFDPNIERMIAVPQIAGG